MARKVLARYWVYGFSGYNNTRPGPTVRDETRSARLKKLIALCLLVLLAGGCMNSARTGEIETVPPPAVIVERPQRTTVSDTLDLPATVDAWQKALLYAKVSGYMKAIYVDKGDQVKRGQLLAVVESPETERSLFQARQQVLAANAYGRQLDAQVMERKAKVLTARRTVEQAVDREHKAEADVDSYRGAYNLADITYRRVKSVFDKDPGLIARQDVDTADANLVKARAVMIASQHEVAESRQQISEARSELRAAESSLKAVTEELSAGQYQALAQIQAEKRAAVLFQYTEIRAPFDGIITMRYFDPGNLIQNSESNAQAVIRPVLSMAYFDVVRVYVQVPESDASLVNVGTPVFLESDEAGAHASIQATVTRNTYSIDENSRTMLVEIDLKNPQHILKPGMMIRARFTLAVHKDTLTVPLTAVIREEGKSSVFVVTHSVAHKVPIDVGIEDPERAEVTHGLRGDENVVVVGKEHVVEGFPVRVDRSVPVREQRTNLLGRRALESLR